MYGELLIAKLVSHRIKEVKADVTKQEAKKLLAEGKWDGLVVRNTAGWGCITDKMAANNAEVILRDSSYLSATVAEELAILSVSTVLIIDQDKPLGILTPAIVLNQLWRIFQQQQVILATVLDNLDEAVTVIDSRLQVLEWNKRAEQLYGIAANEIIGRSIEQYFSNLVVTGMLEVPQVVKEKYHRPKEGTHVLINAAPLYLAGSIVGGVSVERDITEIVNLNRALSRASQEVLSLKEEIGKISSQADPFGEICGHSAAILEAVNMGRRIAATGVPVLLRGESGVGKEIFARALHAASRRAGAFVEINCGAIPVTLFESELFGYQPGAFTGADRKGKPGLFEVADGGTLFLDEIGELPKEMQVKLLRVLQDKSFYRIGGDKPVHVDVRIIAATHRNLEEMIALREFRDDLYYRLNVVTMQLPPLRERREDIPELVHRGLQHFAAVHGKPINRVDPAVMAAFLDYQWPGNVRELYNMLERLVVLADGDILGVANLPAALKSEGLLPLEPLTAASLPAATNIMERDMIIEALRAANDNKATAAKQLGIPRSTLYYKMRQLGIVSKN